ncbi:MAG: zinc ribbon domain-containing protein [Akkermansiaceae bacterium]|nr:zinc ribbon domain-containing protein [Akkermansiaceae bacterium]
MPVYDFTCGDCGDFREVRSIDERNNPARCPDCRKAARRMILAPNLGLMNPVARKASAVNEKSRHEPRVSNPHSCGSGCGCGTPVRGIRRKETPLGVLQTQKPSARPWMLGH